MFCYLYDYDWLLDILFEYFKLSDYFNIIQLNHQFKKFLYNIDQYLWYKIAINEYSKEFWLKAKKRNPNISRPLNNYKLELQRLKMFEKHLLKYNFKKFDNKDYYQLWKSLDEVYNKATPKN